MIKFYLNQIKYARDARAFSNALDAARRCVRGLSEAEYKMVLQAAHKRWVNE